MAIQPVCDICKTELDTSGGILLSPPNEKNEVRKFHLCVDCYGKVEDNLRGK